MRHARRWAAFAIAAVLAFAGCGASSGRAEADARASAARFLDEIREGKIEPAWQGSSTEFKSLMGLENLRDLVKRRPELMSPAEFVETRPIDRSGRSFAECVFRATAKARGKSAAPTSTVKVLLSQAGGDWTVENLAVE